jgi:arylsulfatase A-like enzyme/tetratricopeptide (TPR) repeat protein
VRGLRTLGAAALAGLLAGACHRADSPAPEASAASPATRPSILLVTLDTTRADAIGPEAKGVATPAFDAVAARGRRYRHAYAAVPETLPSHSSLLTGLYPAGHGVHENGRHLAASHSMLAERLQVAGYTTAAFVSSFALARRFGLAPGFDVYDDELTVRGAERTAKETTDKAVGYLRRTASSASRKPFTWVHYFDPHRPYAPPEPFASRYARQPYLGEVAAMDEQLGRLVRAFEETAPPPRAIVVVADHGEGLGEHGEAQHGRLLYQGTMHVPLVLAGPRVAPGVADAPVSTRHVFHTILDWAGLGGEGSLLGAEPPKEIVLGEAMKPFLAYGWQPQVMAVEGAQKAIHAGRLEVYDVVADPGEERDLAKTAPLSREIRTALREYPRPLVSSAATPRDTGLSEDERRRLASLGYVSATVPPVVRADAPPPVDMKALFDTLDRASDLFVQKEYAAAVPLLERIVRQDTTNLDAVLRLATARAALGRDDEAVRAFDRAAEIAPQSDDVRLYRALYEAQRHDWAHAVPVLERIVAETPDRLPAVEALAGIRERQERLPEAVALRQKIYALRPASGLELAQLGQMAMATGATGTAIDAFEKARAAQGPAFTHDLELGVLYLAARRLAEARDALDRVPATDSEYPMALFKRAQVAVLLDAPDRNAWIARARRHADATTRDLIARERLFAAP